MPNTKPLNSSASTYYVHTAKVKVIELVNIFEILSPTVFWNALNLVEYNKYRIVNYY